MVDFAKLLNREPKTYEVPGLLVGVTGHRPHKLASRPGADDGYEWANPLRVRLRERIQEETLKAIGQKEERSNFSAAHLHTLLRDVRWNGAMPTGVVGVSGGALGIDQDTCGVWYRMKVPYIVAVPFPGQESRWPKPSKQVYAQVLEKSAGVIHVSKAAPTTDAEAKRMLGERNGWIGMVSDVMLGVWDGSSGGTSHAIRERRRYGGQVVIIDVARERELL